MGSFGARMAILSNQLKKRTCLCKLGIIFIGKLAFAMIAKWRSNARKVGRVDSGDRVSPTAGIPHWHPTRFANFPNPERRGQKPTDFIYDLLKVHKKLGLKTSKEALVEHIFARLEPQVQDYVEVRNSTTTAKLLQVMSKFEERYSCKEMQGSRSNENMGRRAWDVRRMSND
ncbi:uncharacterized protein TNCV_995511, partial [Trichonephila clavipes]